MGNSFLYLQRVIPHYDETLCFIEVVGFNLDNYKMKKLKTERIETEKLVKNIWDFDGIDFCVIDNFEPFWNSYMILLMPYGI